MTKKVFRGFNRRAVEGGMLVTVEELPDDGGTYGQHPLPLRTDLVNHSPTGFGWGYGGSGAGQLALAILCQLFDDKYAQRHYMKFKWDFVAKLEQGKDWVATEDEIRALMPKAKDNYSIKFSHRYRKLHVLPKEDRPRARLLQVIEIDAAELTDTMVEYDATYEDAEGRPVRYPLPVRGSVLLLVFESVGGIFTTIRPYNDEKAEYYRTATGALFAIELPAATTPTEQ